LTELDDIDRRILAALRNDARVSNKALAALAGIAPSTCLARVARLERAGVLIGYHAEFAPRAIGVGVQAMISVRLAKHSRTDVDAFVRHLLSLREVLMVYHVAGVNDYLVHVAVRDTDHLRRLVLDAFTARPEVAHLETNLIFDQVRNPKLPIFPA
jgi:DNA-binding Lrp family transcriptional regulator